MKLITQSVQTRKDVAELTDEQFLHLQCNAAAFAAVLDVARGERTRAQGWAEIQVQRDIYHSQVSE